MTDKKLTKKKRDFITLEFETVEKNPLRSVCTTFIDIYPETCEVLSEYITIPSKTSFGYGYKNEKQQAFVEFLGKGEIDKARSSNVDYYFRVPILDEVNVYREFGGEQERGYFRYWFR